MKWFKHDTDASIDAKLQELLLDYGAVGYGMYWYCIELIAKDVTPKNFTFELEHDARIIARNLNLSIKEASDIMKKMVDLGLFDFANNNKLRCIKLAYRLDDFTRKGVDASKIVENFNKENPTLLVQSPTKSDKVRSKSDKVPLDKNRKDKKRIEESNLPEWLDKNSWEEWVVFRKEIKKTLTKSTINKQIIFLEKNKSDHIEIISQSIQNGWSGLFELKNKNTPKENKNYKILI